MQLSKVSCISNWLYLHTHTYIRYVALRYITYRHYAWIKGKIRNFDTWLYRANPLSWLRPRHWDEWCTYRALNTNNIVGKIVLRCLRQENHLHTISEALDSFRRERAQFKVLEDTVSLWRYIEHEHADCILNPLYDPLDDVIWPSVAPQSIQLWNAFYLKWVDGRVHFGSERCLMWLTSGEASTTNR